MVQIPVGWVGQLQCTEADVVESLVVDAEGLISVLNKLVHGEGGVVGLHHSVRHLGAWDDAVGIHDAIRELLPNLGNQKGAHARASSSPQGVRQLETLQAVAALCLLPDNIQDTVDQLCALGVVPLRPVVACSTLAKDKVIWTEYLAISTTPHRVHRAGFKIHQDSPRHVFPPRGFIVVDIDPLQLEIGSFTLERASGVDAMFITDDLPELSPDLVAALASLDVDNLPHDNGGRIKPVS